MRSRHIMILLVSAAFLLASCSPADDQATAPAIAGPTALSATPLPTTAPLAALQDATPTPTPTAMPTPMPTPVVVEVPQIQCGTSVDVAGYQSPFRGSCTSFPIWASAETDGTVVTVHATEDFVTYEQHEFPYPDGLINEEDFWPDQPGVVKLYADGDSYVAAVGHVAEGCCFVYVEMSFPARIVSPTTARETLHSGSVVPQRGLRGSDSGFSTPQWAQGTYLYTEHEFQQIGDQTWRVEIEPTASTTAWDPESDTPSGHYWVGPISAGATRFPIDVANGLYLVDQASGRVAAFVRPGVLEVIADPQGPQGISATVEHEEWKWFFGEWVRELPDIGREMPSTLLLDFTDAWTRGDWDLMRTMSTDGVIAVAQQRYDVADVGAEAGSAASIDAHWQCAQSRDDCAIASLGWTCDAATASCNGSILYATSPDDYAFIFRTTIERFDSGFVLTSIDPAGDTG